MSISEALKRAAYDQETGDVFLVLLEIEHDDLPTPIRVVNNTENVQIANGDLYIALPFEIVLPDNIENSPPRGILSMDNVTQEIAQAIRTMTSPARVSIKIARVPA